MKYRFLILSIIVLLLSSLMSLGIVNDEFNRADSDLLEFGWNETTNVNCLAEIVNNTLRLSWEGDRGGDCNVWNPSGQETEFDFETVYRTRLVIGTNVIGTAVTVNGDADIPFFSQGTSFEHTSSTHRVWNTAGNLTSTGINSLTNDVWYQARFKYDGTNLSTKIWFNGTVEPTEFNYSNAFANIDSGVNLVLGENDNGAGEIRFDYIRNVVTAPSDSITIDATSPQNGSVFNSTFVDLQVNVTSTVDYTTYLFVNGTFNQSKTVDSTNTTLVFSINFDEGDYSYFFNVTNTSEVLNDQSGVKTFKVDTITPVITFTTPNEANTTIVNSSKLINVDVDITNTNLHLFIFNVTNSSGSVLFSDNSTTLNGSSSFALDQTVNLENQSEQVFTSSMFVCDVIFNCAAKVVTFTMDSTPPVVTNNLPLNETTSTGGDTSFSFNTTEVGLCTLKFNDTAQETIACVSGTNTFTAVTFTVNTSINWNVVASDNFGNNATSGAYVFTVDIPQSETFFLDVGNCPNDSVPDVLLFVALGIFLIGIVVFNMRFLGNIPIFNAIAGLTMIMVLALPLLGCSVFLGGMVILLGVLIMFIGTLLG